MRYVTLITFIALTALPGLANAMCFRQAAESYGVPEALIRATAVVESGSRPGAIRYNVDGTTDIGLMQINSRWLTTLAKWGITKEILLNDPCMNVRVGTWIMAQNIRTHGYNWDAVGAYNVACRNLSKQECENRRNRYSRKIYRAITMAQTKPSRLPSVSTGSDYGISTVSFKTEKNSSARGGES